MNKALLAIFTFCLAFAPAALADDLPTGKAVLGIGAVRPTPSLVDAVRSAGTENSMNRVIEAMDSQLMDRLHNTRKFTLVARSDLKDVLKEQNLVASGNVDTDDGAAAQAFKLAGCQYLVVCTVDNFQDYTETAHFEGYNESASKRVLQFSLVAKIYNTTTGKLLESADLQLTNGETQRDPSYVQANGDLKEELYSLMARLMSQKVSDRVVDVLYPAKVIAKTDNIVTFNRGDGTNVEVGQLWDAYALGQEMFDPDTHESLGREEVKVGKVRVTDVLPRFSKAEVVEDRGVDIGQILRISPQQDQAPGGPPGAPVPPPPPQ
jgi:Curli production assembly/transport component CsgG